MGILRIRKLCALARRSATPAQREAAISYVREKHDASYGKSLGDGPEDDVDMIVEEITHLVRGAGMGWARRAEDRHPALTQLGTEREKKANTNFKAISQQFESDSKAQSSRPRAQVKLITATQTSTAKVNTETLSSTAKVNTVTQTSMVSAACCKRCQGRLVRLSMVLLAFALECVGVHCSFFECG